MACRKTPLSALLALGLTQLAMAQGAPVNTHVEGIPASNSLGAEDIWHNPDFRGGVVNGGATARSNW
jgi:hypothetical protein